MNVPEPAQSGQASKTPVQDLHRSSSQGRIGSRFSQLLRERVRRRQSLLDGTPQPMLAAGKPTPPAILKSNSSNSSTSSSNSHSDLEIDPSLISQHAVEMLDDALEKRVQEGAPRGETRGAGNPEECSGPAPTVHIGGPV